MKNRIFKLSVLLALVVALVASMALSASAATTVDIMEGLSITDSTGNGSYASGVYTATAKGGMLSKKSNTITITNNGSETVRLSFDYSVTFASAFTIDGASASASGSYEKLWNSGETVTIVITSNSGFSNLTVTLTLKNIAIEAVAAGANVTFNYDSSLGSVTVDGEEVTTETVVAVASSGANLVATGKNGGTFLGWVNANNEVFSTASQYTLKTAEDLTIKAIFVGANSAPHFAVSGGTQQSASYGLLGMGSFNYYNANKPAYIFDNFNTAVETAASTTSKYVVLLNDATLPAGDYTVPAGVTLVVPFNAENSVYTTNSVNISSGAYDTGDNYKQPMAYRTLTMADGANLIINGSLSLPAKHRYANGNKTNGGSPVGYVSFINMQAGSTIQVNNGGALYAYGYITGNGNVIANNGAKVYELFQIMDFRGGDQTTQMENGVFPLSQYYVQNIEVPMTLHYGATEHSYTTVYMQKSYMATSVAFIGPKNAMFNLTSGSVTKQYDGSNDRLVVEVNGNMDISPISMDFGLSDIDSSDYVLPVNGNISITVKNGSQLTIKQDVAMLPGSELIIEEGAFATLSNGCNAYFYDAAEWGNYCGASNKTFIPLTYAPGRTYTRTAADLKDAVVIVNGTVDASLAAAYTTASGANIYSTGNGKVSLALGTGTTTYQLVQGKEYTEIPIVPVMLRNADGSFLETGKGSATEAATYIYNAELGKWLCETHTSSGDGSVVTAPTCTEKGYTTHTCVVCLTSYTDEEDALGHNYKEVVTAPTCENDGYTTHTCSVCQHSYIDDVKMAQGHTVVIDAAVNPDCTNTGLTDGSHCSVCNKVLVAQEEIPALGHSEETDAAVAATCTETGLTEGKHCSVCNKVLVAQEEVAALGHTEVIDKAVAATCTETGLTEGKHCSVCGEVFVAQEVVLALGHNEVIDAAVAPDCNNPGMTEGAHCDRCGEVFVAQEVVPALSHNEVIDAAVAATCTETGLTEGKHCDRCGEVFVAQEEVAALGHTEVIDAAVAATCTETGLTEGKHCSVCGEVTVAQEEVAALGHTEVIDAAVAATCTETGLTEGKHCSVCGEVTVAQEEVAALGHTEEIDAAVAPDCENTGLTEGKHCSVCNEVLVAQEEVAALGHSHGDWVVTKNPTYTETGSQSKTCSACGDVITEEIPVLANPVNNWNICLGDDIGVSFNLNVSNDDEVNVTINGAPADFAINYGQMTVHLAAAQMTDKIVITINGMPVTNTYTVRGYAEYLLDEANGYNDETKALVRAMLVYGGAAQEYFKYNVNDLAGNGFENNAVVPTEANDILLKDNITGFNFYGASMVYRNKNAVRFYFTGDATGLEFAANSDAITIGTKNDMTYVEIAEINPQDIGNAIEVVVTAEDGKTLTVAYSPLNYIVRMYSKAGETQALAQAMYGYYQAALAYMAKN